MKEKSIRNKSIKAGDKVFDIVNTLLLVFIFLIILYPLYYVVIASFSDPDLVLTGKIFLLPKGFQLDSYKKVFSNSEVMNGYMHTIMYAAVGTCIKPCSDADCRICVIQARSAGQKKDLHCFSYLPCFSGAVQCLPICW